MAGPGQIENPNFVFGLVFESFQTAFEKFGASKYIDGTRCWRLAETWTDRETQLYLKLLVQFLKVFKQCLKSLEPASTLMVHAAGDWHLGPGQRDEREPRAPTR